MFNETRAVDAENMRFQNRGQSIGMNPAELDFLMRNGSTTPANYEQYSLVRYALITPCGKVFPTTYCGHSDLECDLVALGYLDRNNQGDFHGALHVSSGNVDTPFLSQKITARQLDAIMDYYTARGEVCPIERFAKFAE